MVFGCGLDAARSASSLITVALCQFLSRLAALTCTRPTGGVFAPVQVTAALTCQLLPSLTTAESDEGGGAGGGGEGGGGTEEYGEREEEIRGKKEGAGQFTKKLTTSLCEAEIARNLFLCLV